ncbi:MAG: acetate--CoA ligase [Actinobacteria bacterium ATB1]|nr:acetate--CoA ligase [Actinobacteria bacterium ATB1]
MPGEHDAIENLLAESRTFPPPPEFTAEANVSDPSVYDEAAEDLERFWEREASQFHWYREWDSVLHWEPPVAQWFLNGTTNITHNCLDRHVESGGGEKVAFHWEGEPGDTRTITYSALLRDVCKAANVLKRLGIETGDRVAIYMPMIPEIIVAMLACARIGAPHTVVFGGFSADALVDRIHDCGAKLIITADGGWRRGQVTDLKGAADQAFDDAPTVDMKLVVKRTGHDIAWDDDQDIWWHEAMDAADEQCDPVEVDSEHMLYLLYTSGTTGKPKGIKHTTGGYMVGTASTHRWVFDIKPEDVYWCAADVGWVTGHSYIVYGPLLNHTTSVMYEGTPDFPDKDRWWDIIERYGVSILYCAPTAIRMFMKWGDEYPGSRDLSSLRLLGTVGEPINPEAWMWYRQVIGGDRCPIVDTWWQTETGTIMISPLPGLTTTKPGSATFPLPGVDADVVDDTGESVPLGHGGYLVLRKPWPAMLRGIYGDDERYYETYWSRFPGCYFAGDGAKRDEEGYLWLLGRVDDVMNVSGHRISTTEVESALVEHDAVAEAAVVGRLDAVTGQAVAAFVVLRSGVDGTDAMLDELRSHVAERIGPFAKPKSIVFTPDLPKTRSGKIMRRLLRDISEDRQLGDVTTLANADIVAEISDKATTSPGED